jgi:hypothetical protein
MRAHTSGPYDLSDRTVPATTYDLKPWRTFGGRPLSHFGAFLYDRTVLASDGWHISWEGQRVQSEKVELQLLTCMSPQSCHASKLVYHTTMLVSSTCNLHLTVTKISLASLSVAIWHLVYWQLRLGVTDRPLTHS